MMINKIKPLSNCILADTCNHTWIPECGEEITTYTDYRLFIDECDMYEYNCDYDRNYEIANYSDCFGPSTGCPKHNKYYRMGNYKFVLEGRKMVYAPTDKQSAFSPTEPHVHALKTRIRYTPNLPARMLKGKRRYTPEVKRRMMKNRMRLHTRTVHTTKKNTEKITRKKPPSTKLATYVIKRVTVIKNGKKMIRVVKGFRKAANKIDSDFLE